MDAGYRAPVLILLGALALRSVAGGATCYVSIQGNDAVAGTGAAPWRTLQHAVDSLKSGDTALVGPGTYRERIVWKHGGTAAAPITLSSVPGARVIVSGADLLPEGWSQTEGPNGVYSHDNLIVRNANHREKPRGASGFG